MYDCTFRQEKSAICYAMFYGNFNFHSTWHMGDTIAHRLTHSQPTIHTWDHIVEFNSGRTVVEHIKIKKISFWPMEFYCYQNVRANT